MPRLSFVVPVYKPTPNIFEAHIKSILDQAYEDWEAVYVLDGKQPEAKAILNKIVKDPEARHKDLVGRIRVIEIEHGGAPVARNAGKAMVSGSSEFICFFDCDSVIEPGASRAWVQMFDKHKDALFVYASYKFIGDVGSVPTMPWNPDLLRVRNFISGCFPVRRTHCPDWKPELKSLQDWDFWLSVLDQAEKEGRDLNKIGKMMLGFAFKTEPPKAGSISAEGCRDEVWLERLNAVKKAHNLPNRDICVASLAYPDEGLRLAKFLDADFWPFPGDKPHEYKTMIQVGYSLVKDKQTPHAAIFQSAQNARKAIFFTSNDIDDIWSMVNFSTIDAYRKLFDAGKIELYCEDKKAKEMLDAVGFKAEVLPIPLADKPQIKALPEKPRFLVDYGDEYRDLMVAVEVALPDIQLDTLKEGVRRTITDYTGLIHFYRDRSMSNSIKRAHLTGRHVISNVQSPYCGYVNDKKDAEVALREITHKVRSIANASPNLKAAQYYARVCGPAAVIEKFGKKEVVA